MATDIEAGAAFVRLFIKDETRKQLTGIMRNVGAGVARAGAAIGGLGVGIVTPLVAMTKSFADTAKQLDLMAVKTGVNVREFSRLSSAAQLAGVDIDDFTGAVEELNIRLGEANLDGTGPLVEAFKKLGINAKAFASLPLESQFATIAEALNAIDDRAERQFLSDEIFGGDAFKIMPLLNRGAAGMAELAEQAERLGLVLDEQQVADAIAFNKAMKELTGTARGLTRQIGAALAPALTEVLDVAREIVRPFANWAKENAALARTLAAVGFAAIGVGAAITGIAFAIMFAAGAITAAGTLLTFFSWMSGAAPIILGVTAAIVGLGAGIGVAVEAFVGWDKVIKAVTISIEALHGQWKSTFKGIVDSIKSGDIESAFSLMFLAVSKIWIRGLADLKKMFLTTVVDMVDDVAQFSERFNIQLIDRGRLNAGLAGTLAQIENSARKQMAAIEFAAGAFEDRAARNAQQSSGGVPPRTYTRPTLQGGRTVFTDARAAIAANVGNRMTSREAAEKRAMQLQSKQVDLALEGRELQRRELSELQRIREMLTLDE